MSAHGIEDVTQEGTYGHAEVIPATAVTAAQWARAEALKAILSDPAARPRPAATVEMMVNAYATLIIEGAMPNPPAGVAW